MSSTGRSSTACSPTARAAGTVREAAAVGGGARAGGARHGAAGDRGDAAGEDRGAARHRRDPRGGAAAGEVPAGADRDHAPARPRPQARAAAARAARHRLAAGAARGGAGAAAARCARAGAEVRGESARLARAAGRRGAADRRHAAAAARGCCCRRRSSSGRRSPRGCASTAPPDAHVQLAGSARRGADSVKDIDLVAVTAEPRAARGRRSASLEQIERVGSASPAGARGRTHSGLSVDLRIAAPAQHGNLLQHFTGSAAHNAALREDAVRTGLHVSEYGVLGRRDRHAHGATRPRSTSCWPPCTTGAARDAASWRPRAGHALASRRSCARTAASWRQAARSTAQRVWPRHPRGPAELIERDIRGDLHCHTVASDGQSTIEEMAQAARALGYEYLAITDHSASHGFGNDVSPAQLREQIERVGEVARAARRDHAAGGQRGQHPARRHARLRGRAARASSTGWWRACTPPSG